MWGLIDNPHGRMTLRAVPVTTYATVTASLPSFGMVWYGMWASSHPRIVELLVSQALFRCSSSKEKGIISNF